MKCDRRRAWPVGVICEEVGWHGRRRGVRGRAGKDEASE